MILDFSQNGLKVVFQITEQKTVVFENFGLLSYNPQPKKTLNRSGITDIQLAGGNQDDHHGAKHTGTSESFTLKYDSHKYYPDKYGNKLEFYLSNDKIAVIQHYQFYNNISAVRSWVTVTNISKKNIGIEYISSFAFIGLEEDNATVYLPHNSWCSECGWKAHTLSDLGLDRIGGVTTKRITAHNTGSWSSKEYLPMGAVCGRQNTLMWQIENNGSWHWEIGDADDMVYLKLGGPTEAENGWYKQLGSGESFETVKCGIAVADSFDSALSAMTGYRRNIINNNAANAALPVIFNDYMNCLMGDPTTEKLLPLIDKAAEVGAEYFCVDAGWYADGFWWDTVGEWQPCDWRFPKGITEVFDYIKAKGMVPGIWLEIEVVGINCPILSRFEDECFFMRHGKRVIDHSRYHFDFRNKKVRDYASSVIQRVVEEYGVGYIKMDYNIDAGIGTEVNSDSFGDGLLQHNRAYLNWIDEIKAKYPELILENCASGGMRMDYAQLSRFHLQSVSDQTNYGHNAVIAANCATAVLPEQAAVWSYPLANSDENEAAFNMISSMLLRIHLSGDITHLSEKQFASVKEGVEIYKSIRKSIPAFSPFYPLGLNTHQKDFACVGYKSKTERYIAVWKLQTHKEELFVPLDTPDGARILYPSDTKCRLKTEENGIVITMPQQLSAVLISC
ncbi:MAG: alpha-galactosidase [Clostridia bacterium]|nr:alpha-galactosidase [Clostridia bacterium]